MNELISKISNLFKKFDIKSITMERFAESRKGNNRGRRNAGTGKRNSEAE